ncbi:MAG TPA: glutamate-5-semialdehyde dehydrogenase, partial [Arenibaculum sp.]|nr:glutamate-5-semialdehyde dehydrogenase [Arenibaculum sp.]
MTALAHATDDLGTRMTAIGEAARDAAALLADVPPGPKAAALRAAAAAMRARIGEILAANAEDVAAARARGLAGPLVDRLVLDEARIEGMAKGLEDVAALPDPVGTVIAAWDRPNGLRIERVRVPLGVIGIIYESRPNVTADAAALCLKSGNACILRGGSECFHSSRAIAACLAEGLRAASLPDAAVQLVPTTDRAAVGLMLTMTGHIDVIIPRGGRSLIERVSAESRIPVIKHLDGLCHVYVDGAADEAKARAVVLNSKMRRTSVCGAAETLLVDRACARTLLGAVVRDLLDAGCEVRGDEDVRAADPRVEPAAAAD